MKYAGFRFEKISAERFKVSSEGSINVNSNFNLGDIKKEEFSQDPKKPIFSFEFSYSLKYAEIAGLEFKGVIYIEIEDKTMIKELEKEKKLVDKELKKFILDVVLAKTHVEALALEEKLNLPFHIQSPRVSFKED